MDTIAMMWMKSATVITPESGTDDDTTKALAATAKSAPTPRPKRGSRSVGLTMKATKATAVAASTVLSSL